MGTQQCYSNISNLKLKFVHSFEQIFNQYWNIVPQQFVASIKRTSGWTVRQDNMDTLKKELHVASVFRLLTDQFHEQCVPRNVSIMSLLDNARLVITADQGLSLNMGEHG